MQYEAKTPSEYFDQLDNDWRKEKLLEIKKMIQSAAPELEEGIEYKMLRYHLEGQTVFNLTAQRGYVSLYVGTIDKVENGRKLLEPFDLGKGCIRVKKSIDLSETELDQFIEQTIDIWRAGGETDC